MKRTGFQQKPRKQMKRTPLRKISPRKPKKTPRSKKMALKKEILAQYNLPSIPCSRYGLGKAPTRQDILKGMLWHEFSIFIRNRDKLCIACLLEKILQAGHFAPAGGNDLELLFSEVNVNGECETCNADFQGNGWHLIEMRKNMIKKYGKEKVEEIETLKSQKRIIKWEESTYVEKIKYYYNLNQKK